MRRLLSLFWPSRRKLVPLAPLLAKYPVYDPPHKVEERVLPRERALENFDYFVRTRRERVTFLTDWLAKHFGVVLSADEKGVAAMNRWMVEYGGLLLPNEAVDKSFFSYDPSWTGAGAGCNVVFDLATAFGEFLIANCPNLHWEMGPNDEYLSKRDLGFLKTEFGSSFQRPEIVGFKLRRWHVAPHHYFWMYASQLHEVLTKPSAKADFGPSGMFRKQFANRLEREFSQRLEQYRHPEALYQGPVPEEPEDKED